MTGTAAKEGHVVFAALSIYETIGGVQRYNRRVVDALAGLTAAGYRITVLALKDHERPAAVAPAVVYRAFAYDRIAYARALLAVVGTRPSIVFLGGITLLGLAPLIRLRSRRTAIWLAVHGVEAWNQAPYRRRQPQDRFLLRRCVDRILAVSRYTADRMAGAFDLDRDRFTVLPNAVDAPATPPERALRTAPPTRTLTVTRLAAKEGEKNVDRLLQALALLQEEGVPIRSTIVGDGPLRPALVAETEALGLADRVALPGRVSDDELARLYAEADLLVLPSKKEGFGIVFLEAWQHGLPVVGGNKDASAEVISDGVDGFTVDPDDPRAIAGAIRRLAADPALARDLGAKGYAKMMAHYTDARFAERLQALVRAA